MKLLILIGLLLAYPVAANAEIHKYKGANGNWVYSDVAPPPNVVQEAVGKQMSQRASAMPSAKVLDPNLATSDKIQSIKEQAAIKRQQAAEQEKKNAEIQQAQNQEKEAHCKSAKANLAIYTQGGRIYKANEKGEREYMDDKAIEVNMTQAKKDINEYCN